MIKVIQYPPYFVALSSGLLVYRRSKSKVVGDRVYHSPRHVTCHPDSRHATPFNNLPSAQWAASDAMKQIPNALNYHALLVMAREGDTGPFYVNMPNGFLVYDYRQDGDNPRGRVEVDIGHNHDVRRATPFDDFESARMAGNHIAQVLYSDERQWYGIFTLPRFMEVTE